MTTRKVVRDAGTGQFVKLEEAKRRPKTTVTETIKVPPTKGKGKRISGAKRPRNYDTPCERYAGRVFFMYI